MDKTFKFLLVVAMLALVVIVFLGLGVMKWFAWSDLFRAVGMILLILVGGSLAILALGLVVVGAWMGEQNIFSKETKPRTIIQVAILLAPAPIFLALWMSGLDFLWAIGISLGVPAIIFAGIGVWILYDHKYAVKESKYPKSPVKKPVTKTQQ